LIFRARRAALFRRYERAMRAAPTRVTLRRVVIAMALPLSCRHAPMRAARQRRHDTARSACYAAPHAAYAALLPRDALFTRR